MGCSGGFGEQQSQRALESAWQTKEEHGSAKRNLRNLWDGGMLVFELLEGNFEAWDLTPQRQGTLGSWRSSALPMQPEICSAALGWVPGLALRPLPCCYLGVPRYYSWL